MLGWNSWECWETDDIYSCLFFLFGNHHDLTRHGEYHLTKKLAYKNPLTWSSILKQWWIEVGSCLSWSRSGIWIYKMACWPSNMWDITSFHEIRSIRLSMTTGYNFVCSDLEYLIGESVNVLFITRRCFFSLRVKRNKALQIGNHSPQFCRFVETTALYLIVKMSPNQRLQRIKILPWGSAIGPSNGGLNEPVYCRSVLAFKIVTFEGSGYLG